MAQITPVDTSSFTPEQMKAYNYAASLAPTPPPTINSTSLSSSAPLSVPSYSTPTLPSTPPPPPMPNFGVDQATADLNQSKTDLAAAENQAAQVPQRQQQLEAQYNVPGLSQKLNELYAIDAGYNSDLTNIAAQQLQGQAAQQGTATSEVGRAINLKDLNYNAVIAQQNVNIKRATNAAVISATQGQLQNARNYIQRALDLEFKPLAAKIDYLKQFLSINADTLSKKEAAQLQYNITQQTRQYEEQKAAKENILKVLTTAAQNGADNLTLSRIQSAQTPDQAIALAGASLQDPKALLELQKIALDMQATKVGMQKTQADITNTRANTAKTIAETNAATSPQAQTKQLETVNSVDNILADPSFNSTFGIINSLNRSFPGSAAYNLSAQINNLVSNLALAARGQMKGQGQVSDFEGKLLRDAQTALKLNMSPDQARKELINVRGAIRTSSGLTAPVLITDPKTGKSQLLDAGQEGINQAIKDGLRVQYQ